MTAKWQPQRQRRAGRAVTLVSRAQPVAGPLCRKVLNDEAERENWPGQDHCTRRCTGRIEGARWPEARRTPPGSWPDGRCVTDTPRDVLHKAIAPVSQSKVCARAEDYVRALYGAVRPWSQARPSADFCSGIAVVGGISATAGEQQAMLAQLVVQGFAWHAQRLGEAAQGIVRSAHLGGDQ